MGYFFTEPTRHTLSITRKAHLQGVARGVESMKVIPLNPTSAKPQLEVQMVELAPGGAASAMQEFREVSGLVYVLEGRLHLEVGGLKEVLEEGDCAYIESEMAVAWRGEGKHRCRLLAVLPGAACKEA